MAILTKIMIVPFFGRLPDWMDKYEPPKGYDFLLDTDLEKFKQRVGDKLGITYPAKEGSGKPWDYRPMLGVLYEEEIKGYDFFGHTDLDCVYGDVDKWVTDEFLSKVEIHSNHYSYVMGAWALYRNISAVREFFRLIPMWSRFLIAPDPNAWVEDVFSRYLEQSGMRYAYTFFQGWPYTPTPNLMKENGKLYQDGEEIMMLHFRRSKVWPL